jgi:hypothetical protein
MEEKDTENVKQDIIERGMVPTSRSMHWSREKMHG